MYLITKTVYGSPAQTLGPVLPLGYEGRGIERGGEVRRKKGKERKLRGGRK